jgi:hypothetical protein
VSAWPHAEDDLAALADVTHENAVADLPTPVRERVYASFF